MSTPPKFHLAITCAGGGTAGAYIAGVLDYLFETLSKWEQAKIETPDEVPHHKVILHIIGGNSAGSISTALAVLNLLKDGKNYRPVTAPSEDLTGNLLYDSWVLLSKDRQKNPDQRSIIEDLLDTKDLNAKSAFLSLLNATAIDNIGNGAIQSLLQQLQTDGKDAKDLPSFITEKFQFFMSLANLKGVPFGIKFIDPDAGTEWGPKHHVNQHKLVAHFAIQPKTLKEETNGTQHRPIQLKLDEEDLELVIKCGKSSGSLPFIFPPKYFSTEELSHEYINRASKKFTLKKSPRSKVEEVPEERIADQPQFSNFFTVDGGTFNNEPFGEATQLMEELGIPDEEKNNCRLILIDPFPNYQLKQSDHSQQKGKRPWNIWELLLPLYKALRNQGLFKSRELMNEHQQMESKIVKSMIYPSAGLVNTGDDSFDHPLASDMLSGLGGFLLKDIRDRDFFLGRYNCQVFLKRYFVVSKKVKPDHSLINAYAGLEQKFKIRTEAEKKNQANAPLKTGDDPYPIVPDLNLAAESVSFDPIYNEEGAINFQTPATPERRLATELNKLEKLKIRESNLLEAEPLVQNRFQSLILYGISDLNALINGVIHNLGSKKETPPTTSANSKSFVRILGLNKLFFWVNQHYLCGRLARSASGGVLNYIRKELKAKHIFDPTPPAYYKMLYRNLQVLLIALLSTLVISGVLWYQGQQANEMIRQAVEEPALSNDDVILGLEFARSQEEAGSALSLWSEVTLSPAFYDNLKQQVFIDYFFLFAYSLSFFLFFNYIRIRHQHQTGYSRSWLIWFGLGCSLAMGTGDMIENLQLGHILNGEDVNFSLLQIGTWLKWIFLGVAFALAGWHFTRRPSLRGTLLFLPFVTMSLLFVTVVINNDSVSYLEVDGEWLASDGLQLAKFNFGAIAFGLILIFVYGIQRLRRFSGK